MTPQSANNWANVTFADVTDSISRGKSPKYIEYSSLPVINQRAIRWFGIQNEYLKYIHPDQIDQWSPQHYIREGDTLLNSTGTGTIGRACLVSSMDLDPPKVVDSHVTIIRPNKEVVDPRYLFAWIRSLEVQDTIASLATGATNQIELNRTTITTMPIPLAPLNEQKRIADQLEALLARVDACRTRLERVPQFIDRFRQAVLASATSGQLTGDYGEKVDTSNWDFERAEDVCEKVQSGGTPKEGFVDSPGIPFLKIYNIVNQRIDFQYRSQFVAEEIHNGSLTKSHTKPGDVLMNIVGPPLGKVAIVPDDYPEWNINQAITLFRPSQKITTGWLYYFLCSGASVAKIAHQTRGSAGQSNISLSQCRNFLFPVPPLEQQHEIVRRIETLFAYADSIELHYQTARAQIEHITPSLLTKAFRGELVPQDAKDEPASTLIKYIREASVGQLLKPKRILNNRKSAMTKMTKESVKKVIQQFPKEMFSFDDLRKSLTGDYDSLKDVVFGLLDEAEPSITQIFDQDAKAIRFVRS